MNLNITKQDSLTDELLEEIGLYHHEQNSLTLSLTKCKLSNEALISSLLFPLCKLHKLSLHGCTISTTDYSCQFSFFELQQANAKVSLNATGSYCAMNHWLSQSSSYSTLLTDMILCITEQDSETETLEGIGLYEQNNLHTLSLKGCKLSSKTTGLLFHLLQSPQCKLHKLSLKDCVIFTTDHTYQFSTLTLQVNNGKFSLNATGSCCVINHWLSQLSSYLVLLTELILSITKQETDETLEGIGLFSHMLEILNVNNNHTTCFSFSIPLFLELRQSNLHTLSLTKCELNSEATNSLIHSLLSPDYKLNKLALYKCVISFSEHTYTFSAFKVHNCNVSFEAKCSCSAINHWLSYLSSYTKLLLTELILDFTEQESLDETLERIGLYRDVLEVVKINGNVYTFPSLPFVGQQQNNLHTLSLMFCKLSSEVTRSLIHSLQSPHCRLHKLALYWCAIPTTDHTLLTTAIVSSTTITHLLFIDITIDTPSLTALASSLKQNRTMEELAFNIKSLSRFTKEQFQLLIEVIDSSAVKKLWLNNDYKELLRDCPLSRDDVVVEWYNDSVDVCKKW